MPVNGRLWQVRAAVLTGAGMLWGEIDHLSARESQWMGLFPSLIYVPLYLIWHLIVIMNYSFMEAPRDSFEICKHMLTLYLASLLVSYTIFFINKHNIRTFPWKLILVIEAENAFWLPLSFFKEIQNVSVWFWLLWARLWHFRLLICEVTKALIAPQAAKKKGAESASIWKLQRGAWETSSTFHVWFIMICSWLTE